MDGRLPQWNKRLCSYDRFLRKAKTLVRVCWTLMALLVIVAAILLFARDDAISGIFLLILGLLGAYISYFLNMALIGCALDLKLIRNKLYGFDNMKLDDDFFSEMPRED